MINKHINNLKNILIPCLVLSCLTGIFTGGLIFAFKVAASKVISLSASLYSAVREAPILLAPFLLGLALLGTISFLILKVAPECKGGGIPTAITIIRGFVSFKWIYSAFGVFTSALVTFFGGVPLGNEGPSVQMGCAVGRGTVSIFARNNKAWDKYIMTGGACAGFAAATGAPLSGFLFAIEEIHRRFSPLVFMSVAVATISSTITMNALGALFGVNTSLFHLHIEDILPVKYLPVAIVVGIACGVIALVFTKLYTLINKFINNTLKKWPYIVKIVSIFVIVGIFGFFASEFTSSGHAIVDELLEGHRFAPYMLLLFLFVRAILLLFANNAGITGGLFVPSLAFGAIVGELTGGAFVHFGLLPEEFRVIMIVVGMASFLAAYSRIPLIAITFSVEALSGLSNILPIAVGCAFAYIAVELAGITDISDVIIENKIKTASEGKNFYIADVHMTVMDRSFVAGKEIRDILWLPTCNVASVNKADPHSSHLHPGDVLHFRYKTSDPEESIRELESLLGKQEGEIDLKLTEESNEHYSIPGN